MVCRKPVFNRAKFLLSAADNDQLPDDEGCEVAFIGRSNAGKSSAINTITGIKGLARTSKTPGRTQMLNFFSLDDGCRLVDLPGYGYAKAPKPVQQHWEAETQLYLQKRECLRGLVLVMDIRHPLKDIDLQIIDWTVNCDVPLHILLTKADKLTNGQARKVLNEVKLSLGNYGHNVSLQVFSSLKKAGVDVAKAKLNEWLEFDE
ncbi:MAG: ribosome biogenesis GTP-binding protein YihA/YsxC [Gammaproteobacteria bacterium]|nr:ribosome biogenesis GTP-binding protein YihA/YsxC [Gammaproteobacteria bacterium]